MPGEFALLHKTWNCQAQGPAQFSAAGRSHWFLHLFPPYPKSIPHAACHRGLTRVTGCHHPPWQLKCHLKERKIFKILLCTACFVCCGLLAAQSQQWWKQLWEYKITLLLKIRKTELRSTSTSRMINLHSLFYTSLHLIHNFQFAAIFRGEKAAELPQWELVLWPGIEILDRNPGSSAFALVLPSQKKLEQVSPTLSWVERAK